MTITDTTPHTLRDMTDEGLLALYRTGGDTGTAALREAARRDYASRAARQRADVRAEWYDAMFAQFLAAEAECRGNLLSREGLAAGIADPISLWSGPHDQAMRFASWELRDFWEVHPRVTIGEYERQRRMAGRIARAEARDITETEAVSDEHGTGLDGPAAGALRREPAAPQAPERAGGTVQRGRRGGGAAEDGQGAGADRRAGGPVQRHGLEGAEDMGVVRATRTAARADRTLKARQDAKQGTQRRALPVPRQEVAVPQPAQAARRGEVPLIPGDQLLDLLASAWFGHHARLPSPAALDAVTLWAAHCWMRDEKGILVFRATPRLCMLSSEPGSGKGLVLELLMNVVPNCYGLDLEPTQAGLVHTINSEHATVCIDESDILFGAGHRKSGVRAVLNGGTYRHGTILNGKGGKTNRVPVFGPVALAGLDVMEKDTGDTLDALMTRFIKIRMVKVTGDDKPPKRTPQSYESAEGAKVWLERWAAQVLDEVAAAQPEFPEGMDGRAEDIWGPLLAVADAAGGTWPDRARAACRELALGKPDGGEDLEEEFAEFAGSFGGL